MPALSEQSARPVTPQSYIAALVEAMRRAGIAEEKIRQWEREQRTEGA